MVLHAHAHTRSLRAMLVLLLLLVLPALGVPETAAPSPSSSSSPPDSRHLVRRAPFFGSSSRSGKKNKASGVLPVNEPPVTGPHPITFQVDFRPGPPRPPFEGHDANVKARFGKVSGRFKLWCTRADGRPDPNLSYFKTFRARILGPDGQPIGGDDFAADMPSDSYVSASETMTDMDRVNTPALHYNSDTVAAINRAYRDQQPHITVEYFAVAHVAQGHLQ